MILRFVVWNLADSKTTIHWESAEAAEQDLPSLSRLGLAFEMTS